VRPVSFCRARLVACSRILTAELGEVVGFASSLVDCSVTGELSRDGHGEL
jgi:hypothetical protein